MGHDQTVSSGTSESTGEYLVREAIKGCQERMDGVNSLGLRSYVDGGWMAIRAEGGLSCGTADEYGGVNVRGQDCRIEDSDHVEPLVARPRCALREDAVDSESLRGERPKHGEGLGGRGRL
jgi:hypothetical protein